MINCKSSGDDRGWRFESEDFAADWRGFLFVRGHRAGEDSVARLCRELRLNGPQGALALAKGSFCLALHDKQAGATFWCTDRFGLVQLFVAEDRVSGDLLQSVRQLPRGDDALDRAGLASFLRYGFYTLGRTIDRRVRVLSGDEIVRQTPGSASQLLHKAPDTSDTFEFESYIADLRTAAADERISLDLTGGIDSRLGAAAFVVAQSWKF